MMALAIVAAACSSTDGDLAATDPVATTDVATTSSSTSTQPETTTTTPPDTTTTGVAPQPVRTGAQVLADGNFAELAGSRVGLIAHQNSVVEIDGVPTHLGDAIDGQDGVELVALFGPEHGVRGTADAGELVADDIDGATGVPIFSLFGETRKPTPEMLEGIDTLVYDLQDVGTRYYTYISTMGLAMQAAAEADIGFVVLDRPNPLGGEIAGGLLEPARTSFVGQYPIPDQYGLTSSELALLVGPQGWLPGLESLDLSVIQMDGWERSMRWEDTGLEWIAPSPAIDTPEAALLYPATIWFEATSMSYGRGTDAPFRVLGAPWFDAEVALQELNQRDLPGVSFAVEEIQPELLPGMTVAPAFRGEQLLALRLMVTDADAIEPTQL